MELFFIKETIRVTFINEVMLCKVTFINEVMLHGVTFINELYIESFSLAFMGLFLL